jgi:hypothetical protein
MIDPSVLARQQAAVALRNGEKLVFCLRCKTARIPPDSRTGLCRHCTTTKRRRFRLFQGGAAE